MCKLQCPRCKNEELKEGQNYCQICGLDLKRTAQEMVVQEQFVNFLELPEKKLLFSWRHSN